MRRLLVLTSVILLAAGCSTDKSGAEPVAAPAPTAGAPAASAPAAAASGATKAGGAAKGGDAALQNNTAAICDQAAKTSGNFAATFAQNLKLQIDAASAKDPAAAQQAQQKSVRDVQNYAYALTDMSKLAADEAVAKSLAEMGKQVAAFKTDISAVDEDKLAGLRATLDKACGRA